MLLLIGPAVAVIGLVAVFFVMRHKSVEKRSMYSSRRSQIEHKVRAARERTLAGGRHSEKGRTSVEPASASAPALTYEPPAYAGPPVAPPPKRGHTAPAPPAWDTGPTAPAPAPSPPTFAPPPPAYEPPPQQPQPQQPPPPQPPYEPPPAAEPWTPIPSTQAPAPQEQATPAPVAPVTTSAGGGASWSVVGETKGTRPPEPEPAGKKKKGREDPGGAGAWALASGELAGDEADEGLRKPSPVLAIAQYAVLVVGLVMVLIGVVVMVANSHVT